jgi:hypothetical protein
VRRGSVGGGSGWDRVARRRAGDEPVARPRPGPRRRGRFFSGRAGRGALRAAPRGACCSSPVGQVCAPLGGSWPRLAWVQVSALIPLCMPPAGGIGPRLGTVRPGSGEGGTVGGRASRAGRGEEGDRRPRARPQDSAAQSRHGGRWAAACAWGRPGASAAPGLHERWGEVKRLAPPARFRVGGYQSWAGSRLVYSLKQHPPGEDPHGCLWSGPRGEMAPP